MTDMIPIYKKDFFIDDYINKRIFNEIELMLDKHMSGCSSCLETDPAKDEPCEINSFLCEHRTEFVKDWETNKRRGIER